MFSLPIILSFFSIATSTLAAPPSAASHRETLAEAASNAKQLVHTISTGTMASVFPALEGSPNSGRPFAMMEYHAPCHPSPDVSLTFVLMPISLSTRNILASEGHHATFTVQMPAEGVRSPMSRGRVAFIGNITILPLEDMSKEEQKGLKECYTSFHPDAKGWTPDVEDGPHFSEWARFDIQDIYYVGGFGDTHYIGHIPVDVYSKAPLPDPSYRDYDKNRLVIQT